MEVSKDKKGVAPFRRYTFFDERTPYHAYPVIALPYLFKLSYNKVYKRPY